MRTPILATACLTLLFCPATISRAADPATTQIPSVSLQKIASPDGKLEFVLEGGDSVGGSAWSLQFSGRPVVTRGALGLELAGVGIVGNTKTEGKVETRNVETAWNQPHGEQSTIPDRFREATFRLAPSGPNAPDVRLQVRAYDEGIAFRYLVDGKGKWTVTGEKTSYPLPATAQIWTSPRAQSKITKQAIGDLKEVVDRPLTAELAPDLFVALGEAGLVDHARTKFALGGGSTLVGVADGPSVHADSFATPWRYVRAASSPSALYAGNYFLLNLNKPNTIGDTSWIRPGKAIREVTLTTQGAMAAIDFAAANNLQFIMFDAGWYGNEHDPKSDATKVNVDPKRSPGPLDLPAIIAYGKGKNVGVILYVNHIALERQLDEILPLYEKWGVAGIKFGFVNVGPQEWTAWLHEAIAKCAKHKLMVDVHDEYRMTGVQRTLPNFMTAEGVRGDEESPKTEEVINTIFTRGLAGAADQTNCYFAKRVPEMGSHGAQLAKTICVFSPWQFLFWYDRPAGSPRIGEAGGGVSVVQDVPEMSFFQRLPTTWDETRPLDGYPGTHAAIARRSGQTWFLGALNGTEPRTFKLKLDFLEAGKKYRMATFSDDPITETPSHIRIETKEVDRNSVIEQTVAPRQGFAVIFTPVGA